MFSKILIPLDGSGLAENALSPASALAEAAQGQIILLRVPEPSLAHVPELHDIHYPDQAWNHSYNCREYLNTVRYGHQHIHPELEIQTRVISGDVASVIINTAVDEDVDLIVMARHGRSGPSRRALGSVTEKVLRHAACPALVVRSRQPVANVLITLDGSALAERALEPGLAVARAFGARVTLLRVKGAPELVDVREVAAIDRLEPGLGEQLLQSVLDQAEAYLEDVARRYKGLGVPIEIAESQGPAAHRILQFAEAQATDLIVMVTHDRTGLRRWVYGSVTEKVLRRASCALLIIRPPKHVLNE